MFVMIGAGVAINLDHVARIRFVSTTVGVAKHYILHTADGTYLGEVNIPVTEKTTKVIESLQAYDSFVEINPDEIININYVAKAALIEIKNGIEHVWRLTTATDKTLGDLRVVNGDTDNRTVRILAERGLILFSDQVETRQTTAPAENSLS